MGKRKQATEFKDLGALLLGSGKATRVINLITLYRIVTFPLLIYLTIIDERDAFKWLLLASFFTDAIDGFLARGYKVTSILGAKLDSIGDDLTVLAGAIALFIYQLDFIKDQAWIFIVLFGLFVVQVGLSFYKYHKISTLHTYLAKIAAVVTAVFLLSVFFVGSVYHPLFYLAAAIMAIELAEEIILAAIIDDYRSNVKGLYWVLKDKKKDKKPAYRP